MSKKNDNRRPISKIRVLLSAGCKTRTIAPKKGIYNRGNEKRVAMGEYQDMTLVFIEMDVSKAIFIQSQVIKKYPETEIYIPKKNGHFVDGVIWDDSVDNADEVKAFIEGLSIGWDYFISCV